MEVKCLAKIRAHVKTDFGEIEVEGDSASELLDALKALPSELVAEVNSLVSLKIAPVSQIGLEGIIELTTEGPVVTTREKLSHYEAIGLILFATEHKMCSATKIAELLKSSGIKSMVPARLNEMTKRGLVFKPDPGRPEFKLTVQGENWIEHEVLQRLRRKST
jgi:hypothetical protein